MKKLIMLLTLVCFFSCQPQKEETLKSEKEEIKTLVTNETLAYMEKNYEKWASFWDHSDAVLRLDIAETGFSQTRGWEKNGAHLETFFKEHPEPITATFQNSNYLIYTDTNLAWAAFDQIWTSEAGEESTAKATVTLVKKKSAWKITSYTAIQYTAETNSVDTLTRE